MLPIIRWYQYFISAKVKRGLLSVDDDFPRDRDDSIKIALIASQCSIMAWTIFFLMKTPRKLNQ